MMVMNDGGNISGVAWNDEGITDDFDNMGSMSTQFNAIRNEWGEHDCITEDTGTTVTFTTDDEPVLLTFDAQTNNFVPVVGELTNRQETMWLRTFQVNNNATTVVVNDNGEPVVLFNRNGSTKFLKAEYDNGDLAITETNDNETLTALETEAGGLAEITVEDSSDGDFHKYIDSENDGYYFITNQDGYITFGAIDHQNKAYYIEVDGGIKWLVDKDGKLVVNSDPNKPAAWFNEGMGWVISTNGAGQTWPEDLQTIAVAMTFDGYPSWYTAEFTVGNQQYHITDDGSGFNPVLTEL